MIDELLMHGKFDKISLVVRYLKLNNNDSGLVNNHGIYFK